jgi:hypothetical protein
MPSGLIRGWTPVRVKKPRQNKNLKFGSVRTETLTGVRERAGRGRIVNDRTRPRKG